MALTGSLNGTWDDGFIDSMTEMRDNVEGQTYSGLDRTNCQADTTVGTIATSGPSSPKTGEIWIDSSVPAAGAGTAPAVRLRLWDGTAWIGVGTAYYAETPPSTTDTGQLWYDQTLELFRVYRSATDDGAKAGTGIAGWHPLDEGYQLWKNKSGGAVSANRVVIWDGTNERGFTTTTTPKDQRVLGVTLEAAAADGDNVVVALVGSGAFVDIYCDVGPGNVAIGDAIAAGPVAGEARTVGSLISNPAASATARQSGTPLGAFAVARAATSSDGVVPCKLLGYVGAGATYRKASSAIATFASELADANWDGGWDEIDGDAYVADSKHKPILGFHLCADATMVTTDNDPTVLTMQLSLGPDASSAFQVVRAAGSMENQLRMGMQGADMFVPTSDGTPYTALGSKFYWKGDKTASLGTATMIDANIRAVGYVW